MRSPNYDASSEVQSFERETELFFNAILRENRPVTDLLLGRLHPYLNRASGAALRHPRMSMARNSAG